MDTKQELQELQNLIKERGTEIEQAIDKFEDLASKNKELNQIYGHLINKYFKTAYNDYCLITGIEDAKVNWRGKVELGLCVECIHMHLPTEYYGLTINYEGMKSGYYPIKEVEKNIITEEEFNKVLEDALNTIKQKVKIK